jgi:hypothetical protein
MQRFITIGFDDLKESVQGNIMEIARNNVIQMNGAKIREDCGGDEDAFNVAVNEYAERELYNIKFVFNV